MRQLIIAALSVAFLISAGVAYVKEGSTMKRLSAAATTLAVGFALLLPSIALAGPLAPKKPSQLVRAASGFSYCEGTAGRMIEYLETADGTSAPFAIPAGQVFVLTGAYAHLSTSEQNAGWEDYLWVGYADTFAGSVELGVGRIDPDGILRLSANLTHGAVFKGRAPLCCAFGNFNVVSSCKLYGYFTKDK